MTFPGSGSRLLREAIAGERWVLLGAVALLAGWQAAEALVPVLVGVIIDRAIATGDAAALAGLLVVLAALFTALMMGFRFGARLTARASEHAGGSAGVHDPSDTRPAWWRRNRATAG